MSSGPCFYPLKPVHGDGDDDGDDGGLHARDVIVGEYCGEVVDVKDEPAAGFAGGRDRSEGVHFFVWEVQAEIRSQN